jgi:selenide,water dikinase
MAAIQHMIQSNRAAAQILRAHGATAATDITGFGLLGHIVEMVRASNVDATLVLTQVPLLDGLAQTIAAGIFSSLQPQNVRLRRAIRNMDEVADHPLYPVLFDPQTAGGLIASVPSQRAHTCLAALKTAGYVSATIVGCIEARSEALEPLTVVLEAARQPSQSASIPSSQDQREEVARAHQPVL